MTGFDLLCFGITSKQIPSNELAMLERQPVKIKTSWKQFLNYFFLRERSS